MKFDLQRFAGETPIETIESYTLADNTTVTVKKTNNGVEFNEGMGALTKAIKAKITASSGGASSGKLEGIITITGSGVTQQTSDGETFYYADPNGANPYVNYNGDGTLFVLNKTGEVFRIETDNQLYYDNADYEVVIYAYATNNYTAAVCKFKTDRVSGPT